MISEDQVSTEHDDPEGLQTRLFRRANSQDEKEQRRLDILVAAKTIFAEKGYNATSISDIAKEANISYGSVYWYFDSKESLFEELMTFEEEELKTHIQTQIEMDPKVVRDCAHIMKMCEHNRFGIGGSGKILYIAC